MTSILNGLSGGKTATTSSVRTFRPVPSFLLTGSSGGSIAGQGGGVNVTLPSSIAAQRAGLQAQAQGIYGDVSRDISSLREAQNPFIQARVRPMEQRLTSLLGDQERQYGRRGVFGTLRNRELTSTALEGERAIGDARAIAMNEAMQQIQQRQQFQAELVNFKNEFVKQELGQSLAELGLSREAISMILQASNVVEGEQGTTDEAGKFNFGSALMAGANLFSGGGSSLVGGAVDAAKSLFGGGASADGGGGLSMPPGASTLFQSLFGGGGAAGGAVAGAGGAGTTAGALSGYAGMAGPAGGFGGTAAASGAAPGLLAGGMGAALGAAAPLALVAFGMSRSNARKAKEAAAFAPMWQQIQSTAPQTFQVPNKGVVVGRPFTDPHTGQVFIMHGDASQGGTGRSMAAMDPRTGEEGIWSPKVGFQRNRTAREMHMADFSEGGGGSGNAFMDNAYQGSGYEA